MAEITFDDIVKVLAPLAAGVVSASSRPAARAITGATGAMIAMQDDARREKQFEREMAAREDEAVRRNKLLDLQTQNAEANTQDRADQTAANKKAFEALGATIAHIQGLAGAGFPGPVSPQRMDEYQNAADVAPYLPSVSAAMAGGPENAVAAGKLLGEAMATARKDKTTAKEKAADRKLSEQGLADEKAYRQGVLANESRRTDAYVHGTEAKAGRDQAKADAASAEPTNQDRAFAVLQRFGYKKIGDATDALNELDAKAQSGQLSPQDAELRKTLATALSGIYGTSTAPGYVDSFLASAAKAGLGPAAR